MIDSTFDSKSLATHKSLAYINQLGFIMRIRSVIQHFTLFIFTALLLIGTDGSRHPSWGLNHGQVSGRIQAASGLFTTGTIAFFSVDQGSDPADRSIPRIPERTAWVDEQGRFAVTIQYGRYLLGFFPGKQKTHPGLPDKNFEPSLAGISKSERYILQVATPVMDAGDIAFYPLRDTTTTSIFTIQGTVRTKTGKPVAGVSIIAKTDLNTFRPQYISRQTDSSGQYTITLPPGSYYLFARHRLKKFGRPVTGEYFGIWGVNSPAGEFGWFPIKKEQDIALHGEKGQTINDADITVFRIPDPSEQETLYRSGGKP